MRDPLDFQRARIYRGSREDMRMRGEVMGQESMLSLMTLERRIPPDHPIRRIKALADAELARLSSLFDALYAERGRPSIAPEALLKACLLIALYSVRSERQFCERLHYDLLFRWFLDLPTDGATFDASTFAKNKTRVLNTEVARRFFDGVVAAARSARLLSADHFSVDGTLIEAWGSLKSFRPKAEATGDRPTIRGTDREFPRRAAAERYACLDDRSRRTVASQGRREGGEARLWSHGLDGESPRAVRGSARRHRHRRHRIDGSARAPRAPERARPAAADRWRRQGVRQPGFRDRVSRPRRHAACGAKHERASLAH